MGKALVFSDLHIHKHKKSVNRLDHCLQALEWVFDTAIVRECPYVFFLGDLFHDRANIDVMVMYKTAELFQKYFFEQTPPFTLYLLVGNHDMYHKEKWDIHSIKPFGAMPNVIIFDSPQTIRLENLNIDFLPHMENPIREIENLSNKKNRLLLAHLAVDGAFYNPMYGTKSDVIVETDNEMKVVSPDLFKSWELTLLGHYHAAQKLENNVEYVGSPLELTFGEAFCEKHVILLDLDTLEKEYIVNDFSPKHLIVPSDKVDCYDLENKFVRITYNSKSPIDLIDFKNKLKENSKPFSLEVIPNDENKEEQEALVDEARSIIFKDDMLETWIDHNGVPNGMDKNKLLSIGSDIKNWIKK